MTPWTETPGAGDVVTGELPGGNRLPLQVEARAEGLELADWAQGRQEMVDDWLVRHGGVLFRGFRVEQAAQFEGAIDVLCGGALDYTERSSPRSPVAGKVYTSTDHPASQPIYLHNEQSYNLRFPRNIAFYCHQPAAEGGATPVADCRNVHRRLDPAIRDRFEERGYRYVRHFHAHYGLSWQDAFQTDDRATVERYCADNQIDCEWRADGVLRTAQRRRTIARHPVSGEETWFNHLTFFHVSTLEPAVRDFLLAAFGEDALPNNTYYGDGAPIEEEVLDRLRRLYAEETVSFPWRRGDVLLLDNMLTAHGRTPFSGARKILTAMARPTRWSEV